MPEMHRTGNKGHMTGGLVSNNNNAITVEVA